MNILMTHGDVIIIISLLFLEIKEKWIANIFIVMRSTFWLKHFSFISKDKKRYDENDVSMTSLINYFKNYWIINNQINS